MGLVEVGKLLEKGDIKKVKENTYNYIGIDLGETWTVGASSISSDSSISNLAIRKKYFYSPLHHYRHFLEDLKEKIP